MKIRRFETRPFFPVPLAGGGWSKWGERLNCCSFPEVPPGGLFAPTHWYERICTEPSEQPAGEAETGSGGCFEEMTVRGGIGGPGYRMRREGRGPWTRTELPAMREYMTPRGTVVFSEARMTPADLRRHDRLMDTPPIALTPEA